MNRRSFLETWAAAGVAASASGAELDAAAIAQRHRLVREQPTPSFFEGMLLGNGDIGVCVTVRPDALGLHLGKEDSWDIRVSEDHYPHVLHFRELLKLWELASEEAKRQGRPDMLHLESSIPFFREYTEKVSSSYRKPWPRPWPCGIVWLHWDPRTVRLVRQVLDPSDGLLTIDFEHERQFTLRCFVSRDEGHVCVYTDQPAPFLSVTYHPNLDRDAQLPPPETETAPGEFFCYQLFPDTPSPTRAPQPRSFTLCGLFRNERDRPFRLDLAIATTRDAKDARREAARLSRIPAVELQQASAKSWRQFWSKSAVEFEDRELERIWYHNQYFLACCLREGRLAPGLFGNWMSGRIGTAWHGDYHMNYNTQQVYWGVFSSNHVEQHLPYVELCEHLLPLAESYAHEKFSLPGAFFFHTAYPVPSQTNPYPVPPWGYEVCETPWTVQSLWWHYLYTLDKDFLERVYPLLRSATRFLAAYVKGTDGTFHIIPTVSPENWGFTVDYRLNKDCIMDLALTQFVMKATVEAAKILGVDAAERTKWAEIQARLAPYPKGTGLFGEVWLDVVDAPTEYIYNVPVTLAPVFPGEQVGLGIGEEHLEIARRTARTVRLEGGNDLVYQPLIRARLGMLDLDWFKREVRYCLMPNGVANDRVRQAGGRYRDSTDFDFMMRMGVWTENLSLPAVLNECLLQSYTGVIRLFPNTTNLGPARFRDLRAAGAFLVSAAWDGKTVSGVSVLSEKAAPLRLWNPWGNLEVRVTPAVELRRQGRVVEFPTRPRERYSIERVRRPVR